MGHSSICATERYTHVAQGSILSIKSVDNKAYEFILISNNEGKELDQILELIKNIPQCDMGAPSPAIYSDEISVYLFYYLEDNNENWDGTYVNIRNNNLDEGVACITFKYYTQYKFGSPNDEAINGHPLYNYGLQPYKFFEVKNSEWIKNLMEMNRGHPNHKDEYFNKCRHFIYFFHDNCFEIICESYSYEIMNKNIKESIMDKIKF